MASTDGSELRLLFARDRVVLARQCIVFVEHVRAHLLRVRVCNACRRRLRLCTLLETWMANCGAA